MKKITIDLNNDSIVDLTIDELKKLQVMVKTSIQIYNRNSKKKKPIQGTLFSSIASNSEIPHTFEQSNLYNWNIFEKTFSQLERNGIDICYYYNAVKDWSRNNPNKKKLDWKAQTNSFMRIDIKSNKLKMIDNLPKESVSVESMLEYLNM